MRNRPPQPPAIPPTGPGAAIPLDSTDAGPPLRLGEFRIVRLLGEGAMGKVYEAVQESLQRKVALKVLPKDFALGDPDAVTRFEREAQSAANLQHRAIVPIYGYGYEHGHYFYAMQLVPGRSLAQLIHDPQQPLRDERQAAVYALHVAEALDYAHRHGVIHRDVKPANIMVPDERQAMITDFGLARRESAKAITQVGALMGTPTYMAPEQALGDTIDHRIDIYALGVTLYEAITFGKLPFFSTDLRELLVMITSQEAPPAAIHRPAVSPDLDAIARKAMAKKREDRYQTCGELAQDLIRYLRGDVVLARQAGPLHVVLTKVRKHKAAAGLGALLFLVVTGGLIGLSVKAANRAAQAEALLAQARQADLDDRIEASIESVDKALGLEPDRDDWKHYRESLVRRREQAEERARAAEREAVLAEQARRQRDENLARARELYEQAAARIQGDLAAYRAALEGHTKARAARDAFPHVRKHEPDPARAVRHMQTVQDGFRLIRLARDSQRELREAEARLLGLDEAGRGLELAPIEAALEALRRARLTAPADAPEAARIRALEEELVQAQLRFARGQNDLRLAATLTRQLQEIVGRSLPTTGRLVVRSGDLPATARLYPVRAEAGRWVRDEGRVRELGLVPAGRPLVVDDVPVGTHLLELQASDRVPVALPLVVQAQEAQEVNVVPPARQGIPAGFVYVPPGEHYTGGDPEAVRPLSARREPAWVDGFFIAVHEVTVAEFADFLNSMPVEERGALRPPVGFLPQLSEHAGEFHPRGDCGPQAVCGVKYEAARRYCEWRAARDGVSYRLPTDLEWDKAARSPVGWSFPWGNGAQPEQLKQVNLHQHADARMPEITPPGRSELDRSIYGVLGLGGNLAEWVDGTWPDDPRFRIVRGGSWFKDATLVRAASRQPVLSDNLAEFSRLASQIGFRLAFD